MNDDIKNIFNRFIDMQTQGPFQMADFISARPSETTNSFYIQIKDTSGQIYELALSDHASGKHVDDLSDIFDSDDDMTLFDSDDYDDVASYLSERTGLDEDQLVDCEYFGVQKARPYASDTSPLVGKLSLERAFVTEQVSGTVQIKDAYLIENDQILVIDYQDLGDKFHLTESYINHVPQLADIDMIATIDYLINQVGWDAGEARRFYYHAASPWRLISEVEHRNKLYIKAHETHDRAGMDRAYHDELDQLIDSNTDYEIYDFNGHQYIADLDAMHISADLGLRSELR